MKIQTKTTLLFTVLTATIFLILNITVYYFIRAFAHRDFNKRVELRARIAAKLRFEKDDLSTAAFGELQQQYLEQLPHERALIIPNTATAGRASHPDLDGLPGSFLQDVAAANGETVFFQKRFRHYAGLLYKDQSGQFLVIKSASNEYGSEMMQRLRLIKVVTFICAVVMIYSVGLYFAKKTFQPIRDIINRVTQISQGSLHLRLKETGGRDEIAELTTTFNLMLNRLETAFEAQNNFVSNASHELRTPLTAIIGEADYALNKSRSAEDYQQSLQQIADHAGKLQQLTKGLLALAQTGFTSKEQAWSTVRLDQLLFDVKENCDALAPSNQVQVIIPEMPDDEAGISIMGNYHLLKIAVSNIVLNACKYSNNQPVRLQLNFEKETAHIIIQDQGIGIPREEVKYIYHPFFRASNTTAFEGYGIGMPLSNNIVRLHRGSIHIQTEINKGTEVNLTLPLR